MKLKVWTKTEHGIVTRILHTATLLHAGWEMDNHAWVVELDSNRIAVFTTSHGSLYEADRREFEEKLRETEESVSSIRQLLELTDKLTSWAAAPGGMIMQTVGTCGECNGPVQVPEFWGGKAPPVPTCAHCGATAKDPYGPVVPMHRSIT